MQFKSISAALIMLSVVFCGSAETTITPERQAELKIVELVNQGRVAKGLAPLRIKAKLQEAALQHSDEMLRLNYFSHTSPNRAYQTLSDRLRVFQVGDLAAGENIYWCEGIGLDKVASQSYKAWLDSPGHRANMESPDFNAIGIGLARQGNKYYLTQVFSHESTEVVSFRQVPQGSGYQISLKARVVDGPREGAILFNGKRVSDWRAGDDGCFECQFEVPGAGKVGIGQTTAPRNWSINSELEIAEAGPGAPAGLQAP